MDNPPPPAAGLVERLSRLDDPRTVGKRRHRLGSIPAGAFRTVRRSWERFTAMESFGQ